MSNRDQALTVAVVGLLAALPPAQGFVAVAMYLALLPSDYLGKMIAPPGTVSDNWSDMLRAAGELQVEARKFNENASRASALWKPGA